MRPFLAASWFQACKILRNAIIQYSIPVLEILYPITITIVMTSWLIAFTNFLNQDAVDRFVTLIAFC